MASKSPASAEIKLGLRKVKETKGTYVYTMVAPNDIEIGSVYLSKLLFVSKPADEMEMVIKPKE
jgi:hypothetical protein